MNFFNVYFNVVIVNFYIFKRFLIVLVNNYNTGGRQQFLGWECSVMFDQRISVCLEVNLPCV